MEGVDGSSPSEGFSKVPANWHFTVVCTLNTRTHSGHICGTRDALRRFATSPDACLQGRREHIEPRRPCNRARGDVSPGETVTPSLQRGGHGPACARRPRPPHPWRGARVRVAQSHRHPRTVRRPRTTPGDKLEAMIGVQPRVATIRERAAQASGVRAAWAEGRQEANDVTATQTDPSPTARASQRSAG